MLSDKELFEKNSVRLYGIYGEPYYCMKEANFLMALEKRDAQRGCKSRAGCYKFFGGRRIEMILVYVKPENEEQQTCWELPIKHAKTHKHLMKRIHKMLKEEYGDVKYEIKQILGGI